MLAGTIIGAGIFSLPFVFKNYGLLAGITSLFIFSLVYALVYFIYADIVLRTEGEHRFVGYSKIYLGKTGFWAAVVIGLVQLLLVLTVYLILAPSFIGLIFGGSHLSHLLFFWILSSILVLMNNKNVALSEFFIVSGIILIIFVVFCFGAGKLNFSAFSDFKFNLNSLGVIGPVLFALSGVMTIPEVVAYFKESSSPLKFLKRSLLLGGFLPALGYGAFVLGIIALSKTVSADSVTGLIGQSPQWLIIFLGVLGFLSLVSSYVLVGLNTRHILEYDFSFSPSLAGFFVVSIPPILYLLGMRNFTEAVSFTGSVFIPLEIILLIFIWLRANKIRPTNDFFNSDFTKATLPFLLGIFLIALVYAIIK